MPLTAAQAELTTPSGMSHGAVWFASCRMTVKERPTLLLDLPDPCLLKVLQCCADDQRSLFNAARAHPTLHRAAVVALSSISADIWRQRKVDGAVLLYLSKYRQHVHSVTVAGYPENYRRAIHVRELPPDLQLNRLKLTSNLNVQLQPGGAAGGPPHTANHTVNMLDGQKGPPFCQWQQHWLCCRGCSILSSTTAASMTSLLLIAVAAACFFQQTGCAYCSSSLSLSLWTSTLRSLAHWCQICSHCRP